LVVNNVVCEVLRGRNGEELLPSEKLYSDLFPTFGPRDELWVAVHAHSREGPPTMLRQLAPRRRVVDLPDAGYPDLEKEIKRMEEKDPSRKGPWVAWIKPGRVAFSPTGPVLLRAVEVLHSRESRGYSERVGWGLELWNYQERKRLAVWGGFDERWTCFQFSPDGRRAVTGSDKGLKVWAVDTGEVENALSSQPVDEVRLSPDGRRVLAVKAGERAALFEVDTGRQVQAWEVTKGAWQAFALSPDGAQVVSGGKDKRIRLWDAATGRELAHWQGHDGGVTALLFSRDGTTLYSGS
jgi:hypothetical protein